MKQRKLISLLLICVVLLIALYAAKSFLPQDNSEALPSVRIAVTPYQDTTLMLYGIERGFFKEEGITLEVKDTTWNEQIEFVVGGGSDIAMATLDEIVAKDKNLTMANRKLAYFLPAWLFEGIIFAGRDDLQSYSELREQFNESEAKRKFVAQLKGKKIAVPEGGVYEQAIRKFIASADEDPETFSFVNAQLEAGINGLNDHDVAIAAAGIVERPEALRRGYKIALDSVDLDLIVITGFFCKHSFYKEHPELLSKFIKGWYRSVSAALENPKENYAVVSTYIDRRGAKAPTFEDMTTALKFQRIPESSSEAWDMFLDPKSPIHWEKSWDAAVENLADTEKGDQVPDSKDAFVAQEFIPGVQY